MSRRPIVVLSLLSLSLALTPPLAAEDAPKAEKAPVAVVANPGAAGMGGIYKNIRETLAKAAEKMPEESYSFKPTPEVRSFGQIVAHVADAQNFMCKLALGETVSYSDAVEKSKTSKTDLIAALKESSTGCEKVFAQTDAQLATPMKMFGMDVNRFGAATIIVGHAFEHYGNMVTYLRIKGIVPPSSEPRPAPPKKDEAPAAK